MAIQSSIKTIQPSENITEIMCIDCRVKIWVVKDSDCDVYTRCTRCCDILDRMIQRSRNDS